MASIIDMSLEEIIKTKKIGRRNKPKIQQPNPNFKNKKHKNLSQMPFTDVRQKNFTDARQKIISKKRTQITDAREKLSALAKQKDARLKLEELRMKRALASTETRHAFKINKKLVRTISHKEKIFNDPSRQVVSQPLSNVSRRQHLNRRINNEVKYTNTRLSEKLPRLKPIYRTVENDLEMIDDPMEDIIVPAKERTNRKPNLHLKIITRNNDLYKHRNAVVQRTTTIETEQISPKPTSILKKRPMAALRSEQKEDTIEKPILEYRIIVSNLSNTVTGGDIEELFGDVGSMVESRLVRPGTAEVIYKTLEDAQRAVDLYHNRQLDGQPMNCLLVTPRPNNSTVSRSSNNPALYSTNSNVEPDITTFHKVLFGNL